jgi:hypothetical protein
MVSMRRGIRLGRVCLRGILISVKKNKEKWWEEVKVEMTERCVDIVKASARKLVGKYNHTHGHNLSSV